MPVEVAPRSDKNHNVAVCVQATFGHPRRHRLVEWFEMQRLLGVSSIGVYTTPDTHVDTRRTLQQYAAAIPLVHVRTVRFVPRLHHFVRYTARVQSSSNENSQHYVCIRIDGNDEITDRTCWKCTQANL